MPVVLRWLLRLGPTNPIAVRLVQNGSRRMRHFYIRAGYLGVLIAALLYALLFNISGDELSYRELAAAGAASFTFAAYLQIILICVLAPVFMAGAIAQEANPRTWDILLTTPLGAAEIVLGNIFGRLFFILALLFSSLPLFAVTQYFGGVPGSSIFASYLIAACAALLVAATAVALSVSRLVGKRAVFTFYVGVISYLAVTWAVDAIAGGGRVNWMTSLNPFLALQALLNPTGYPRAPEGTYAGLAALMLERPVTAWCVLSAGASALLMALSVISVRTGGLTTLAEGSRSSAPWHRRVFGLGAKGSEYRAPRTVWQHPIAWREAAARNATPGRMLARWSFIALGVLFGLGVVAYYHGGGMTTADARTVLLYAVLAELGVIALVAVNMAASAVAREREDGTLDLLLTTPITPGDYLSGKLRGMIAYLLPLLMVPIGTLGLAGLYVLGAQLELWTRTGGVTVPFTPPGQTAAVDIPAVLPESILVLPLVAIPFTAFCVMVGLQWSLKSKGALGAVVATVGIVGVVAGTVGLCAYNAGGEITALGPVLGALSPATVVFSLIYAESGMYRTIDAAGLGTARVALFIGAVLAAMLHLGIVYGMHANMVRTFDMTVRKLAGFK